MLGRPVAFEGDEELPRRGGRGQRGGSAQARERALLIASERAGDAASEVGLRETRLQLERSVEVGDRLGRRAIRDLSDAAVAPGEVPARVGRDREVEVGERLGGLAAREEDLGARVASGEATAS